MSDGPWMTICEAWEQALYGASGFYREQQPRDHFRTSVHASPLFAEAILTLVRRHGLEAVTDLGSGAGELLVQLHLLAPDLSLRGVDLRPKPRQLDPSIWWEQLGRSDEVAAAVAGSRVPTLVLANELLDNIPCALVELDHRQIPRHVEVDLATSDYRLGSPVSTAESEWLDRWWPLTEPGQRGEVGIARDEIWAEICSVLDVGVCIAVDYGHLLAARPTDETLTSYQAGREAPPAFDCRHDITAHVAVDAVADAVGARLTQQSDMLRDLGVSGARPDLALASSEPAAYVRALARASQGVELTATPGLGDFWWIVTPGHLPKASTPRETGHP